jgi:hypothetical protein
VNCAIVSSSGEAQIAETTLSGRRRIIRRVPTLGPQGELFPDRQHFPFATNSSYGITLVEAEHRRHAVVEPQGSGARALPSGHFHANAAWTVIAAIAHNLLRWTSVLGLPGRTVRAARTIRRRCSRCPAG